MKTIKTALVVIAIFFANSAAAMPADHPANPAAVTPAFQPEDYFAARQPALAAAESGHQHDEDAAPVAEEKTDAAHEHEHEQDEPAAAAGGDESEGKGCKRGGCCCCCKCCDMGKDEAKAKVKEKMGCGMMKKDMMMEKGKKIAPKKPTSAKPAGKQEEGHEAHH